MLLTMLSRLGRVRVTLGYSALLLAVATALLMLGPHVQEQVVRYTSTNLRNLGDGRIGTLIGSAFVTESGRIYIWLPGLVALLGLGELLWHSRRLVVAFVIGHIGATLLVAAGLAVAVGVGLMSMSVIDVTDVGMSYGAVAVLGTLTAAIPDRWRAAWIGWWLAVAVGSAAASAGDFTSVGHGVALVLGMLVGTRFGHPAHWTKPRYALLAVAASFGYMIMAYTEIALMVTAPLGLIGALGAHFFATRRRERANAALPQPQPAC